jgi:predicted dehydrogenase
MVYCEWPLGRNLAEAVELAAFAKDRGVRTVIGLQSRATPVVNYVKDLVRDGYLGEVMSATNKSITTIVSAEPIDPDLRRAANIQV